jgi:RNA polymerase sigma factor (sigma-70 family)
MTIAELRRMESCIPALRRYACALLGSRQDGDDLVLDCLVRALSMLDTRRGETDTRVWLFTIMHNLFISPARRIRARLVREPPAETYKATKSKRPNQENGLLCSDLVRGLQLLPAEQRAIVLLVSVEDLSYAEIASVLGVPLDAVMSRLSRGRERLRKMIKNEEDGALPRG